MKAKLIFSFALLMVVAIGSASAQTYRHKAENQRGRIVHGKRNGELTRAEAHRLAHQQAQIRKDYHRYKCNDGRLSKAEKRKLERKQRKASRQIYVYKHNRFDRY